VLRLGMELALPLCLPTERLLSACLLLPTGVRLPALLLPRLVWFVWRLFRLFQLRGAGLRQLSVQRWRVRRFLPRRAWILDCVERADCTSIRQSQP
jgi:hypothetical protein